jgi:hypothetical protein
MSNLVDRNGSPSTRYARRINLLGGSGSMLDYVSLSSIPTALSERYHVNAWYLHLKFESRLLDLVFPVVRQAQVIRTGEMWDPVAMQEFHDRFIVFKGECDVWRRELLGPGRKYTERIIYASQRSELIDRPGSSITTEPLLVVSHRRSRPGVQD